MAPLIVVTGPPGAGKSTSTRLLADRLEHSVLLERELFLGFIVNGRVDPWLREANPQNNVVIAASAAAAGRYASGGYTTVYDGVLPPRLLAAFFSATGLEELHYVVILPPEQSCLERVANRQGHRFTNLDAAAEMHRWFREESVDARHVIDDPVGLPGEVVDQILSRLSDGRLSYRGPPARRRPT